MVIPALISGFDDARVLRIDKSQLADLLEKGEILKEATTGIAGRIRLVELQGLLFAQERNPEGELFLHLLDSQEAGESFVRDRLAAYERMWDG